MAESMEHVFRDCQVVKNIWQELGILDYQREEREGLQQWLSEILTRMTSAQRKEDLNCRAMINNRVPTPFAVEALACLQAVKVSLDVGFRLMVVEGDALNIIKKVKSNDKDKSVLS
ncbi:hypothetical protein PVK06_049279 [Gossypium arboreum]|uniref:RNase H type-1 domain-containing protein n=1 Tax=Gossypium arboreum TaxID=29729 RepID=A0ABR0MI67_GOSAR|nr:hypothetical protein PVK06_049279 [Gossypium arboreum]